MSAGAGGRGPELGRVEHLRVAPGGTRNPRPRRPQQRLLALLEFGEFALLFGGEGIGAEILQPGERGLERLALRGKVGHDLLGAGRPVRLASGRRRRGGKLGRAERAGGQGSRHQRPGRPQIGPPAAWTARPAGSASHARSDPSATQ
jgi:hypothetical protein